MILKSPPIAHVLMIRPGATEFDDQQRMKGSLDMPISVKGQKQIAAMAEELSDINIKTIFVAPERSARETAEQIAASNGAKIRGTKIRGSRAGETKIKVIEAFRNVDHGLWHGKLIDEVRRNHPRVYRTGIDTPEELCPPEGEPIREARERSAKALKKCLKKSRDGVVAFVISDPMAAVIESMINGNELHDIWSSEIDNGSWNLVEFDRD